MLYLLVFCIHLVVMSSSNQPLWSHSHQLMPRRGKASGTLRSPSLWPSPPSSPPQQPFQLLSPWQQQRAVPRPRSSLQWAPSLRKQNSEEQLGVRAACMKTWDVLLSVWRHAESRGQTVGHCPCPCWDPRHNLYLLHMDTSKDWAVFCLSLCIWTVAFKRKGDILLTIPWTSLNLT